MRRSSYACPTVLHFLVCTNSLLTSARFANNKAFSIAANESPEVLMKYLPPPHFTTAYMHKPEELPEEIEEAELRHLKTVGLEGPA